MKFYQKKSIMLLSLFYLLISSTIDITYAQNYSTTGTGSGILSGTPSEINSFDIEITKEKFNDVSGSITVPNPQDVLELDFTFYPNTSSKYGDLTGLDILTLDKLRASLDQTKRSPFKRGGIEIENVPQVYEIALSTFREESKHHIKNINLSGNSASGSFVNVAVSRGIGKSNSTSQNAIEEIRKHIKSGNAKAAAAVMSKNSEKLKKDPWFMAELAAIYEETKKYNQAAALYEKAVSISPNRIELMYSYAYCLYKAKKYDKAEKYMKKILTIDPNFTLAHYNLGNIYFKKARYHDALKEFNEVIKLNPLSADAYYNAGLILELTGHKDLAVKYYDKCLTLQASDNDAKNAINRIKKKAGG